MYAYVQKKLITRILFVFALDSMTINASSNSQYDTKLTLNSDVMFRMFRAKDSGSFSIGTLLILIIHLQSTDITLTIV